MRIDEFNNISVNLLEDQGSWIFFPKKIIVEISIDGKNFLPAGSFEYGIVKNDEGLTIRPFSVNFEPMNVRYIKITAENIGEIPEWHPASKGQAYLFVDEIIFN